ncbi:hypothetical protein ABL78_3129 [Leptomonas seymouri]|uniref:EngB-type G domain-containing protein n=1 Tax=Leptomonas seymouri TaxID=5684 RepID=A0A0N1ILH8_LEPSE|nr:hypothetical protein ABL78_3129 [Leptomonas seymouri]|eukprot:KPI87771.1 hypothetical protein ABL78_3129 [Leptomonas seymouri]
MTLCGRRYGRAACLHCYSFQESWAVRGCISLNTVPTPRGYSTRADRLHSRSPPRGGLLESSTTTRLAERLQQSPWGDATGAVDALLSTSPASGPHEGNAAPRSALQNAANHTNYSSAGGLLSSTLQLQRKPRQQQHPPLTFPPTSVLTAERANDGDTVSHRVEALSWSVGNEVADVQDDDIVLDTPASLLPCASAVIHELRKSHQRLRPSFSTPREHNEKNFDVGAMTPESSEFAHPAARGVGQDVIDLVTDSFTAQREAEIQRRREVLYELTHPNPIDYTYNGKLVPPPPLSFGQVTEEARSLGNKMMLGQTYSLARQAGARSSADDFCGTIYTSASQREPGKATVSPSSVIETTISGPSSSAFSPQQRTAPYRRRAREDNIFRDHNYFFEVNELYQEIVLVGKACAGKSSLLNSLLGQSVAKTSSNPNTTRKISFYQSVTPEQLHAFHTREHHNQLVKLPGGGLQLTFVDMPGYGIEGMSDQWRDAAIELTDAYFGVRRSVNTVLYCMDCERGLTKTDMKYFEWLENVQGTFFVVLTKCDSVPHSRITSVMRQVYTLITKNRRKYRKVFPFIIPTSAKDGTNMELLRGLITETSGMIPGDKLRDLLRQKKEAFTQTALLEEASRIDAARQLERAQAREFFKLTRGDAALENRAAAPPLRDREMTVPSWNVQPKLLGREGDGCALQKSEMERCVDPLGTRRPVDSSSDFPSETSRHDGGPQRYVLGLGHSSADVAESLFLSGQDISSTPGVFPSTVTTEEVAAQVRRERRERFLAWRRAHPLTTATPCYDASAAWERKSPNSAGVRERPHASCFSPGQEDVTADQRTADGVSHQRRAEKIGRMRLDSGRSQHHSEAAEATTLAHDKGRRYRLHTGLDNPQAAQAVLEVPHQQTGGESGKLAGDNAAVHSEPLTPSSFIPPSTRSSVIGFTPGPAGVAPPSPPSASRSPSCNTSGKSNGSVSGGGAISQFLDTLEGFSQQPNVIKSAKQRHKEAFWQRRRKSKKGDSGLLAEDTTGRLSPYQAGMPCGPALSSLDTSLDVRQAKWRAEKLTELITKENPEAPWLAMRQLRRKLQIRQEDAALSGMRKKEVAAYVRDAGSVTEKFEKFEGEVTTTKYMNEIRQAPTVRSQQQMHLNATAKLNYRSMPPGLWKRYGERETYWPTPQVLGRAQHGSHKR